MTVKELKEQLKDINDNVEIDAVINLRFIDDERYDIAAQFELMRLDVANEEGYIELISYPKTSTKK